MNLKKIIVASLLLTAPLSGQILLDDQFAGIAVDSSCWAVSEPFYDSSATVSNGRLSLSNGAGVLSAISYSSPIEVMFSFAFTGGSHDSLRVFTRVDNFHVNGYGPVHGVGVTFRVQSDPGDPTNNITLENSLGNILCTATVPLVVGVFYEARLVDTGSSLAFFINGSSEPLLTAATIENFGGKVVISNREGAGNYSFISAGSVSTFDYVTISAIPEPGSYGMFLGLMSIVLCVARRRQSRSK